MNIDETKHLHDEPREATAHLALLPLKNVIILPKSILPIIVGRATSIQAVEYALKHEKSIFISTQKDATIENPTENDVFQTGIRATILQVMRMPNGALKILVEGICRAHIKNVDTSHAFMCVYTEDLLSQPTEKTVELEALWRTLREHYEDYAKINDKIPHDLMSLAKTVEDMDAIADTIAVHINLSFDERQAMLETPDLKERLIKLNALIQKEIQIAHTEQRIKGRMKSQFEKSQREYYLHEQIKAINKELGRDDTQAEIIQIKTKIKQR